MVGICSLRMSSNTCGEKIFMSFQVHSELVKVAELTFLELEHHVFSELGNSGFPSSIPSTSLLALESPLCLTDTDVPM